MRGVAEKSTCVLCDFFSYAESIGAMYWETSAKDGHGVDELFTELAKRKRIKNCMLTRLNALQ